MRLTDKGLLKNVDWVIVLLYLALAVVGILNIYASIHSGAGHSFFDPNGRSGRQIIWLGISLIAAFLILFVFSPRIYESLSLPVYIAVVALLALTIFVGANIKGSHSWLVLGPIRFQPAEISKIATSLLLATIMSRFDFKIGQIGNLFKVAAIVLVPMLLIVLQKETGSALVYVGFMFVLYREGLSGWVIFMAGIIVILAIVTLTMSPYAAIFFLICVASLCDSLYSGRFKNWLIKYLTPLILLGLLPFIMRKIQAGLPPESFMATFNPIYILLAAILVMLPIIVFVAYRRGNTFTYFATIAVIVGTLFVFSTKFIFNHLPPHQQQRILSLLGMLDDPSGVGYNVKQSMIAIGSGGFTGKGFMEGTQTTYGFVPEQSTDFIFCTIGEEWGFWGASLIIIAYVMLILRIVRVAEQSKEAFTRIYGYCVASCMFMHVAINIGMTIGLMPVIGIPLPFISYGGSSLLAFTVMLFIFIALASYDRQFSN